MITVESTAQVTMALWLMFTIGSFALIGAGVIKTPFVIAFDREQTRKGALLIAFFAAAEAVTLYLGGLWS